MCSRLTCMYVYLHARTTTEVGTIDEFARTHRELVVGGVGLAVAVPSLIGAFPSFIS